MDPLIRARRFHYLLQELVQDQETPAAACQPALTVPGSPRWAALFPAAASLGRALSRQPPPVQPPPSELFLLPAPIIMIRFPHVLVISATVNPAPVPACHSSHQAVHRHTGNQRAREPVQNPIASDAQPAVSAVRQLSQRDSCKDSMAPRASMPFIYRLPAPGCDYMGSHRLPGHGFFITRLTSCFLSGTCSNPLHGVTGYPFPPVPHHVYREIILFIHPQIRSRSSASRLDRPQWVRLIQLIVCSRPSCGREQVNP